MIYCGDLQHLSVTFLDGAAEEEAALSEGPVFGQHVHRRHHHRETQD